MKIKFIGENLVADFVIVGSGASGGIFANILSQGGKYSVILLEAGPFRSNDQFIRRAQFNRIILSDLWYDYGWWGQTVNEPAMANRAFLWPQTGRISGGSTSINNLNMVKPSPANLQQWENLLGSFWSVQKQYQAYKEIETFRGVSSQPETRGNSGPLQILQIPQSGVTVASGKITTAMAQVTGIPVIVDYNAPSTPIGQTRTFQNWEYPNGDRSDSYTAFIDPIVGKVRDNVMYGKGDNNIVVIYEATAQGYYFSDREAHAVDFLRHKKCYRAYAKRGVIDASGLLSAQLLMVSGIGPIDVLEKIKVKPVVINENVGKDLQNHNIISAIFNKPPADYLTPPNEPWATTTTASMLPDPSGLVNQAQRGLMVFFIDGLVPDTNGQVLNYGQLIANGFQLNSFSRGVLTVNSEDVQKIAIVDTNYLTDNRDLQFWFDFFRKIIKPFAAAIAAIDPAYTLVSPPLATIDNNALLEAFIRNNLRQTHHGRGPVRMAPKDQGGVVDAQGRVYGVKNLLCWNASVLPFEPDGNTAEPIFGGAWILSHWLRKNKFVSKKIEYKCIGDWKELTKKCNPF